MVTVEDELIVHNDAYIDSGDVARQLGLLPPRGSPAEARLTSLANVRTRPRARLHGVRPSGSPTACGWSAAASRSRR